MKSPLRLPLALGAVSALCLAITQGAGAQQTSRVIPFNNVATTYPASTTQSVIAQLWDDPNAGNLLFSESQPNVNVDANSNVRFVFGSATANGLDPGNFPSGASRFLDVVDATTQLSVLANGRLPLNAVAFALSPGPAGPAGPPGPAGPQGPPGVVQTVSPGDSSIIVAGTAANPTVAVAANGITSSNVADGALSPAKILGIAATLGANMFAGNQAVNGDVGITGNLTMVDSSAAAGNILKGGVPFIHNLGFGNTFVGKGAGNLTLTGGANTAVGDSALHSNTTGADNTAIGLVALSFNTAGNDNTAIGDSALHLNTTGSSNTASGTGALAGNNTGSFNTASGASAPQFNTAGRNNTASGANALQRNTTGNFNTASGAGALLSNTAGNNNTAIGDSALNSNTTGNSNTASGVGALAANTSASFNTASGAGALQNNTGDSNTASGANALLANTTGRLNSAFGAAALQNSTDGNFNVAVGQDALGAVVHGTGNIGIGIDAGAAYTGSESNNIDIGQFGVAGDSNTIRIGNASHTRFFAPTVRNSGVSGVAVLVTNDGQLGVQASSRRFKEQVHDMGEVSEGLLRLRPVTFYYKQGEGERPRLLQYGLIAEEVAAVYPELVEYSPAGEPFSVRYHLLGPMLLNEVQKERRAIEQQRRQIEEQAAQMAEVKADNADLKARLEKLERTMGSRK